MRSSGWKDISKEQPEITRFLHSDDIWAFCDNQELYRGYYHLNGCIYDNHTLIAMTPAAEVNYRKSQGVRLIKWCYVSDYPFPPPLEIEVDLELWLETATMEELKKYIRVTEQILAERTRVLEAIPECETHGNHCVPHALKWVEEKIAGNYVTN